MDETTIWQTKLAARLHDPIEKALILMRTAEGHEGGTSKALLRQLNLTELDASITQAIKQADHWASAADRAAFPIRNSDGRYPAWQQVRFHERPVIIHPLTGEAFDLGKLTEIEPDHAKALALDHLGNLIHPDSPKKTALAFWRFGPDIDAPELKSLWAQLPADTRVPDHSIFDHLDLTTALASSFICNAGGPALLAVSLGPVQDFIAASRSTSDLWAGSHLLSRLAWEAMKVVCDRLGPEAILFPRLRGIPQVDLWLRDYCGIKPALFEQCPWTRSSSDANPLFAAALPNRFTALVPRDMAQQLAEEITQKVRDWILHTGQRTFRRLLEEAGIEDSADLYGYRQLASQLEGFPEIHWATVPWSLADTDAEGKLDASTPELAAAMQPFFESSPPGYLGSQAWQLISGGVLLEEGWFWKPNPGTLYPALHELLERALAAVKSVRPFTQAKQTGWRDSLTGEAEWLTTDEAQLALPPGQRTTTLWSSVHKKRPGWVKNGEHLSVSSAIKRLWPTLLVEELGDALNMRVGRFVVSTHTMAIATSLAKAVNENRPVPEELTAAVMACDAELQPLPRKLVRALASHPDQSLITRIPGWLDRVKEGQNEEELINAERMLSRYLGARPEAYFGIMLMDGDQMGAWLSAAPEVTLTHAASFHPQIQAGLQRFSGDRNFQHYAQQLRAPSPSRHMAISEALNNFALTLAPEVIERHFHGRVLYAGGDDLMAMLPVADLLPAIAATRAAYSGITPERVGVSSDSCGFQRQGNGFCLHRGRLMRLMGDRATASCGAVIAHHQAPLGAVLRELRSAEQRAKHEGERDAFSLTIIKRSGGALRLVAKWGEPIRLLIALRDFLSEPDVSRRAVYNTCLWLRNLPVPEGEGALAGSMLAYQLSRQTRRKTTRDHYNLTQLAQGLVSEAISHAAPDSRLGWLENFLSIAEFLARESRLTTYRESDVNKEATR